MTSTTPVASLDAWSSVLRLSAAWTIGILTITLMPIEVAALMTRLGWSEATASAIAGVQVLGIVMACAFLPRRIARLDSGSVLGLLAILGAAQVATAYATSPAVIGALRFAVGVCEGAMIVSVGTCLASHPHSEVLWGKVIFLSGVFAAGMLTGLAYLPDHLQQRGVWIGLGVAELLLGLATLKLPALRRPMMQATKTHRPKLTPSVLAVWAVMILMYTVQQGQWTVAGLHGSHQGIPNGQIGLMLAVSSLVGFAGCVITSLAPLRMRRAMTAMACLLAMAVSLAWFFTHQGTQAYFYSQLMLNLAFNGLTPLVNAVITERDTDGSLLSRSVVVAFTAASVGTIGSGAVLESLGASSFGGLGALMLLCAIPAAARGMRRLDAQPVSMPTAVAR